MSAFDFKHFKEIAKAISKAHRSAPKGETGDTARNSINGLANNLKDAIIALAVDDANVDDHQRKYKKARASLVSCVLDLSPETPIETEADASISLTLKRSFVKKEYGELKIIGTTKYMPILLAWLYWKSSEEDAKAWHEKIQKICNRTLPFVKYKPDHEYSDADVDKFIEVGQKAKEQDIKTGDNPLGLIILRREEQEVWTSLEMKYSQVNTDFVGRRKERERLTKFMSNDPEGRNFVWWQIAGSAGQGKSRIALELVKEYSKRHWVAGFVAYFNDKFVARVEHSMFNDNTLIVIDYASDPEKSKLLGELIHTLATKQNNSPNKIRLLVLDRQPYDRVSDHEEGLHPQFMPTSWQYSLLDPKSSDGQKARGQIFNKKHALTLKAPSDDELRKIANKWAISKANAKKKAQGKLLGNPTKLTKNQMERVNKFLGLPKTKSNIEQNATQLIHDRMRRPLFAILAADAVLRGITVTDEKDEDSFEKLLDYALDHDAELMFGKSTGNINNYSLSIGEGKPQNMAIFANIVGKYNVHEYYDNNELVFSNSLDVLADANRLLGYSVNANTNHTVSYLSARQPDLLAEYQVLRFVKHHLNFANTEMMKVLLNIAFEQNTNEVYEFLLRCVNSFGEHTALPIILQIHPINEGLLEDWFLFLQSISLKLNTESQKILYEKILSLKNSALQESWKGAEAMMATAMIVFGK